MPRTDIEWTDEFLIGIPELDHEHRALVRDINRLHRALGAHPDRTRIADTLGEILARMQAHFALEESVMKEHAYPHYGPHKAEHEVLLDTVTGYIVRFNQEPGTDVVAGLGAKLGEWIVHHILTSDKKMSLMMKG
ncbi:MAG: hemerythrin family protein [Rhodospirillales bacterium]|nr:MAG: hemerythrin family protein [Rhodospirillales bacterium]